jgi:chorismate dehydratase
VTKLRISVVQYLNTAPLIRGFTHGPQRALAEKKYDLSFTVPSQCAEALRTGAADVAIIPAIEYQRIVGDGNPLTILPGLAIASKERVRSLLVISKVPIRQARRIALDRSSRSTQALVKILAARHWQISPEFIEADPEPAAMLANSDAALIIGDAALRVAIAAEAAGAIVGPDAEWLTPRAVLDSPNLPVGAQPACPPEEGAPARHDVTFEQHNSPLLHIYDVVEAWWRLTEKPAVLAVWAARSDSFPNHNPANSGPIKDLSIEDVAADFLASRDFGLTQIPQIAAEAAREMHLPENELRFYLEKNIDYSLDGENLNGLQHFWHLSSALGITGAVSPIHLAAPPHAVAQKGA